MEKQKLNRYNDDWASVSCLIRVHRAKNCCESCGIPNGLIHKRYKNGTYKQAEYHELELIDYYVVHLHYKVATAIKKLGFKRVILTVAHIDHNEKNDLSINLICECQWCHLKRDRQDNWNRRRYGYMQRN